MKIWFCDLDLAALCYAEVWHILARDSAVSMFVTERVILKV